ncbi:MAG: hypothetical protein ACHQT9_02345 [Candidatus Saccharimonadales bacterium]
MKSSHNKHPSANALRNAAAVSAGILVTALSVPIANASGSTHKGSSKSRAALTRVIERLDSGGDANVLSKEIDIAGRTGVVTGRPLEFRANGQEYIAFREGARPDFDESASKTAASMTIQVLQSPGDSGPAVVEAGLNSHHVLVDEHSGAPVGYATHVQD